MMLWPPSVLRVLIRDHERDKVRLWLPLFLIWPLLLALGIALAPLALLVAACGWRRGFGKTVLYAGPRLGHLFCALRGLDINIQQPHARVRIVIW